MAHLLRRVGLSGRPFRQTIHCLQAVTAAPEVNGSEQMEAEGLEPSTSRLEIGHSTTFELRPHLFAATWISRAGGG